MWSKLFHLAQYLSDRYTRQDVDTKQMNVCIPHLKRPPV